MRSSLQQKNRRKTPSHSGSLRVRFEDTKQENESFSTLETGSRVGVAEDKAHVSKPGQRREDSDHLG
jgi:hypothetical protein